MEGPYQSRVGGLYRKTQYIRNSEKKRFIVRICVKEQQKKELCLRISQEEKGPLESQETDGLTTLKLSEET